MEGWKWCTTIFYLQLLLWQTFGQGAPGYDIVADFDPPPEVLADTPSSDLLRYNIRDGSSFNITCSVIFDESFSDATVDISVDGVPHSNQQRIMDNESQLSFTSFGPAQNGFYLCNVSLTVNGTGEVIQDASNYGVYQTGSPGITVQSQLYVKLPSDGPLVLEAEFNGVYYNHTWVYHPSDPNATDATNLIGADGVEEDLLNGRLVVDPSSPSFQVGYYTPRIYADKEGTILEDGNIFVFMHSVTAELTGNTSAVKFGDNLTLTCTGTGYPEVSVNFDHSSIQAPVVVGEEVVMRSATPTTPSIATRNITIQGVTLSECEAVVRCVANGTVDGTPSTMMSSKMISIDDEVVELSKSGNVFASIGVSLNLSCRGYSCETDSFAFAWYMNGGELNSSVPGVNIEVVGEDELSHLTVDIASESFFGNYTCEVVNFGISTSVLVYELVHSVTAELTGDTSAVKFGDYLTLTCTGTGYPEVSVNFDHSRIQAPVWVGEEVVLTSATPATPSIATRNITIQGVTLSECEAVVRCVANGTVEGTPSTMMISKVITIDDEVAELSKSGNVSASIGDRLNLTCRGYSCETDSFVFEWYLNGAELNSTLPGVNIEIAGEDELSHLTVDIASLNFFGNYTCEVVNFGVSTSVIVYELVTVTADMDPPSSVLDNTPSSDPLRFNVMDGSEFSINCSVRFTSPFSNATVEFYKDGALLVTDSLQTDVTLSSRAEGLSIVVTLFFRNFTPTHNGLYACNVTSEEPMVSNTQNYRWYHSGSPSITVQSQPHLKLPSDNPLVLEAEFSGVYYNHTWVYHRSDPNATDATNLIGADGVEEDLLNGRLVVNPSSPSFQVGYYIPRIYVDEEGTILEDGNIFVFSLTTELTGSSFITEIGGDITLTCTGTGYPELSVNFNYSDIQASVVVGEEISLIPVTPTSPFFVTRNITLQGVTQSECDKTVQCIANNTIDGARNIDYSSRVIITTDDPVVALSQSGNLSAFLGTTLNLTCRAYSCEANTFVFAWFLNGVQQNSTTPDVEIVSEDDLSHLTVNITSKSFFGTYTCELVNFEISKSVVVSEQVHSVTVELTGDTSAVKFGDYLTLTCTGTGYPEVSVNFDYSGIQVPVVVGEEVVMTSATPTTPSIATRNITIQGVTLSECEAVVRCVANGTVDGTPNTVMSSEMITIDDEVIELSKSGNVSVSIGDRLNLTCQGYSCETDSFVFAWYLNGGELNSSVPGVNIGIVGEDELSHLSLDIASESSFGNYTCEVVNFGTSISVLVYELATVTADMDPPSSALDNTPSSEPLRFNVMDGSTFSINCSVRFTSPFSNATVEFYKDGALVVPDPLQTDVTLSSHAEGLSIVVTLSFHNFTQDHSGLYMCNVTSEVPKISNTQNYRWYYTGPPSINLVTQPFLKLPSDGPLVLEAEFSGVYYNHTWVYHPSDPNAANVTNLIGADGVEEDLLNGRLVVDPSSPSLQVGYYSPRIYVDERGSDFLEDGAVLVKEIGNITANLTGESSVITGEDVELTCIGRGFPLVAVDVDASEAHDDLRIIVSRETVTEPTSTEPFIVSRTLTFRRVTVRDCMSVKCTVSSAVAGERTVESQIVVDGPAVVTANEEDQVAELGQEVHLSCSAYTCQSETFVFAWFHNGAHLDSAHQHDNYTIHQEEDATYLTLTSLTKTDVGEYKCFVLGHNVSAISYVNAKYSIVVANDLSQPPRHVLRSNLSTPNVFNVEEKAQFSISCTFDGFGSDFTLRMYKDDAVLPTPRIEKQFLTSPSRIRQNLTVEFEFSKAENTGTYLCVAENGRQSVVTRNISLISENVCRGEKDSVWDIPWVDTRYGHTDEQPCLEEEESGVATRMCNSFGQWEDPDVTNCESPDFRSVRLTSERLLRNLEGGYPSNIQPADLEDIIGITVTLVINTNPRNRNMPLFPRDLNTTNIFLDIVSSFANQTDLFVQPQYNEKDTLRIADYILDAMYQNEWVILNKDEGTGGSPLLLSSVETISLVIARELESNNQSVDGAVTFEGDRISIKSARVTAKNREDGQKGFETVIFPVEGALGSPGVCIPEEVLRQEADGNGTLLVVTGIVTNFTNILPRTFSDGMVIIGDNETSPYLVIAQVSNDGEKKSVAFQNTSVKLTFETERRYCQAHCVFWDSNTDKGWSMDNVSAVETDSDRMVTCQSSHLTSFTVLVDYTPGVSRNLAFTVVSYVGCAISLVCVLLSLIFFLSLKKEVIEKTVYFVHANLCISLLLGLFLFFFIEVGGRYQIEAACSIVTFLIHYAFLSIFCWMMCEAVMMYTLLVKVFGANQRKWFVLYVFLGWGVPLIPTVITVIVAYATEKDYFIMTTRCQWLCWLSQENYFIWAFIAPMLLIILINIIIGARVMYGLINFYRKRINRTSVQRQNINLIMYSFKSFVCLLPLLGITWLFGLLAANHIAGDVFAWLFIIFNTLQGVAIFFLHVVRHDKIWSRIEKTYCCRRWKEFSKQTVGDSHTMAKTSKSPYTPQPEIRSNVLFNAQVDVDPLDLTLNTTGDADAMEFMVNKTASIGLDGSLNGNDIAELENSPNEIASTKLEDSCNEKDVIQLEDSPEENDETEVENLIINHAALEEGSLEVEPSHPPSGGEFEKDASTTNADDECHDIENSDFNESSEL